MGRVTDEMNALYDRANDCRVIDLDSTETVKLSDVKLLLAEAYGAGMSHGRDIASEAARQTFRDMQ